MSKRKAKELTNVSLKVQDKNSSASLVSQHESSSLVPEQQQSLILERQSLQSKRTKHVKSALSDDVSSAEEEQQKRLQKRMKFAKDNKQSSHNENAGDFVNEWQQMMQHRSVGTGTKVFTLSQLTQDNMHMRSDTDCKLAQQKLSQPSGAADANTIHGLLDNSKTFEEQAAVVPYYEASFKLKRDALPLQEFYSNSTSTKGLTQAEFEKQLRTSHLSLPLLTADYESQLLAEAGHKKDCNGILRHFPACIYGAKCVGTTERFNNLTNQVVFTALMFPDEYEQFLETNR